MKLDENRKKDRALLCYLKTDIHDHIEFDIKISETEQLAKKLNFNIVDVIIQTRLKPKSDFILGRGKIEELKTKISELSISKIIFYNKLTSKQRLNLTKVFKCEVIDRNDIILELFKRGARDRISLLQIEYANLLRMLPYFKLIARQKYIHEHPFFKSRGEYAYHSQVKSLNKRLSKIKNEIENYLRIKDEQIKKRIRLGKKTVCISGYYNAGKTTLFNILTGENKPVSDQPFSTMSSKYQSYRGNSEILFVDTIGFVTDMDFKILKSFNLNMKDIKSADSVLFAVSLEDDVNTLKFKVKEGLRIYDKLGVPRRKLHLLMTKMDLNKNFKEVLAELINYTGTENFSVISCKDNASIVSLLKKITHFN